MIRYIVYINGRADLIKTEFFNIMLKAGIVHEQKMVTSNLYSDRYNRSVSRLLRSEGSGWTHRTGWACRT